MAFDAIDGDDVIGVVFGFEVEDQRRVSVGAEGGRGEGCAFETVGSVLFEDAARGPGGVGEVVRHVVEESLDTVGSFQAAQFAEFGGGEVLHALMQCIAYIGRKALTTEDTEVH